MPEPDTWNPGEQRLSPTVQPALAAGPFHASLELMPYQSIMPLSAETYHIGISMRIFLLGLSLAFGGCNDHKRAHSFDARPSENNAAPYNGVPEEEQKKRR
jgi:hypothetical protein